MPCIVLLTDFGYQDYFVGVMKGVISGINPVARLVDLTHQIEPQNVKQASFVLWASYRFFPEDSIFVSVVDLGVGSARKIICGRIDSQIFIAPDNGLLDYVISEANETELYEVSERKFFLDGVSTTFHGRDIFAPVAAHISRGAKLNEFGAKYTYPKVEKFYSAIAEGENVGEVVYIDHFGNIYTNLLWDDLLLQEKSRASFHSRNITKFCRSYSDAERRSIVGIKGSSGLLEIAVNRGSAAAVLKAKIGDRLVLHHRLGKDGGS